MIGNVHQAQNFRSTDTPSCGDNPAPKYTYYLKKPSVSTYIYKITDKLNNNNKKNVNIALVSVTENNMIDRPISMSFILDNHLFKIITIQVT